MHEARTLLDIEVSTKPTRSGRTVGLYLNGRHSIVAAYAGDGWTFAGQPRRFGIHRCTRDGTGGGCLILWRFTLGYYRPEPTLEERLLGELDQNALTPVECATWLTHHGASAVTATAVVANMVNEGHARLDGNLRLRRAL